MLCSLILLTYEMLLPRRIVERGQRGALLLIVSAAMLPVLQLVPLPPSIWSTLPGRELVLDTLRAANIPTDRFLPLTFDSLATAGSALQVLPALALFIAASRLRGAAQSRLVLVVVLTALASLLTFILPVGQSVDLAFGVPPRAEARFEGLFANSNHQATFMLVAFACLVCLYAIAPYRRPGQQVLVTLLAFILVLGAMSTRSRMVLALFPVILIGCAAMIWHSQKARGSARRNLMVYLAGFLVLLSWSASLFLLPSIMDRLGLDSGEDLRFQKLPDIVWAVGQYFPAGTGLGTFDLIFRSSERLDQLSVTYLNQAHNEYLQILLECGLAGAILLAAGLLWYCFASHRAWRQHDLLAQTGSIAILIYLLHSLVDYPLRTISHAALLGVFMALMSPMRPLARPKIASGNGKRSR